MGLYWDNGKDNGNYYLRVRVYSPPEVDRIWGIWGTCFHIGKATYSIDSRGTIGFRVGVQGMAGSLLNMTLCWSLLATARNGDEETPIQLLNIRPCIIWVFPCSFPVSL